MKTCSQRGRPAIRADGGHARRTETARGAKANQGLPHQPTWIGAIARLNPALPGQPIAAHQGDETHELGSLVFMRGRLVFSSLG